MPGSSSLSQADAFAATLPVGPSEPSGNEPRVLITSALKLTRAQEDALIQHAHQRKGELANELGLRDFESPDWHTTAFDDTGRLQRRHLDTRHMAMMAYEMRYEWRPFVLGGIFNDSNLHIPITRRILQQVIARLINYFIGTDPYFSAYDVGIEDADLADRIDKLLKHVLDSENDTKSALALIIERILVCGEADVALSYARKSAFYEVEKEVLVDDAGNDILASDNDYIIKGKDSFIPKQVPVIDPATGQPQVDPQTQQPVMQEDQSQMVLKRDGVTPMPAVETYVAKTIWRESIVQEGPQADLLMPYDFLMPLNCKGVDDADCIVHNYDEPLIHLLSRIQQVANLSPKAKLEYVASIAGRLTAVANTTPKAAENKGQAHLNEPLDSTGGDRHEPQINWSRYCLWFDVKNTGSVNDILLILTADGTTPLYYDYVQNITPDHRRPYRRLRVNPRPGRSDGQGLAELFEPIQTDADLMFNRWNFSMSKSARVDFWHPENTVEGGTDPDLKLNGGKTYRLLAGKTMEETLKSHYLTDIKSMPLREMLEFITQLAMNMSGIANVNDGMALGLDTTKLATGVKNLEKSGQEVTDKYVSDIRGGLRDLLKALMMLAIQHIDSPKTFRFFNGDLGALVTIQPEELRDITLDVNLELTKYRGEQEVQQNTQAANAGIQFYAQQPPAQAALAPLFIKLLKAFGIKDAASVIQPMPMLPPGQPPAGSGPSTPPPPTEIAI